MSHFKRHRKHTNMDEEDSAKSLSDGEDLEPIEEEKKSS